MRLDEMTLLFDFNTWTNHRLLDAAERLDDERFRDPDGPTNLPLRSSFVHMLDTEWWWRLQMSGKATDDIPDLADDDFPSVADLRRRWEQDEDEARTWLATLDDAGLECITPPATGGPARPVWQFLMHRLMHSRQLQADVATLLSLAGHSPGDLDFNAYLREREASRS